MLYTLLKERFDVVEIAAAAEEVRPFLRDPRELALWSQDLCVDLVSQVKSG